MIPEGMLGDKMRSWFWVRFLGILGPVIVLLPGCGFEPHVEPLVIPTTPPQPFSAIAPTHGPITRISPEATAPPTLQDPFTSVPAFEYPVLLGWATTVLTTAAAILGRAVYLRSSEGDRPNPYVLVFIGLLLGMTFLFVEVTLGIIEVFLVGFSGVVAVLFGLLIAAITLFLLDFLFAYSLYVYRVVAAPPGVKVFIDLNPLTGWGQATQK